MGIDPTMNDLKIWKAIFEVRYPAAAQFFDNRGKITGKWQWTNDLSEWRITNNQVSIHNKSNSTFLNASIKNLSVSMELPDSQDAFISLAAEFSSWVLNLLEVKKIERLGFRAIQIAQRKHFKLLVNKMRQNLYGLNDNDWEIFRGIPEDIAFPLVLNMGETKINFNMGPMKNEQLSGFFEAPEIKNKLPNVALYVDFDVFQTEPKFSQNNLYQNFLGFLDTGIHQIMDISNKFMDKFGAFQ